MNSPDDTATPAADRTGYALARVVSPGPPVGGAGPDDIPSEQRIDELLDVWEEAFAAGNDLSPVELCQAYPDLLGRVSVAVAGLRWMYRVRGTAGTAGPGIVRDDPADYGAGDVIDGRFRLEERLAEGGSGVVWRCVTLPDRVPMAIKLPRFKDAGPAVEAMFLNEARLAQHLFHRNIVPVYHHGRHGTTAYIVYRLIEGPTLADRIRRASGAGVPGAAKIAGQIADALAHAHREQVIHRDLKPSNILLTSGGHVYLIDFGISLSVGEAAAGCGGGTGTEYYMAPEQHKRGALDERCDLYAFGLILHELLTGCRLPRTDPRQPADLSRMVVPAGWEWLLRTCLAPDPNRRMVSGESLSWTIDRLVRHAALSDPRILPNASRLVQEPISAYRQTIPTRHALTLRTPAPRKPWKAPTLGLGGQWAVVVLAVVLFVVTATIILPSQVPPAWLAEVLDFTRPLALTAAVVVGILVVGLLAVRIPRSVIGFLAVVGGGLLLALTLSGTAESLFKSGIGPLNGAMKLPSHNTSRR